MARLTGPHWADKRWPQDEVYPNVSDLGEAWTEENANEARDAINDHEDRLDTLAGQAGVSGSASTIWEVGSTAPLVYVLGSTGEPIHYHPHPDSTVQQRAANEPGVEGSELVWVPSTGLIQGLIDTSLGLANDAAQDLRDAIQAEVDELREILSVDDPALDTAQKSADRLNLLIAQVDGLAVEDIAGLSTALTDLGADLVLATDTLRADVAVDVAALVSSISALSTGKENVGVAQSLVDALDLALRGDVGNTDTLESLRIALEAIAATIFVEPGNEAFDTMTERVAALQSLTSQLQTLVIGDISGLTTQLQALNDAAAADATSAQAAAAENAVKIEIINRKTLIRAQELGITAPTDNVRALINANLTAGRALSTFKCEIVFEDGSEHEWQDLLTLPSGICLRQQGEGILRLTKVGTRMLRTATDAVDNHIDGRFFWDANNFATQHILEAGNINGQLHVDGSRLLNTGADLSVLGPNGIAVGSADGCVFNDIEGDGIGHLINWQGQLNVKGAHNGKQLNTKQINPSATASFARIGYGTENLLIDGYEQQPYAANIEGGQPLSVAVQTEDNPIASVKGLKVRNGKLRGRPGVGHKAGLANGATGDGLALRGCEDFLVEYFDFEDLGEYGIDGGIHGSSEGVIRHGTIKRTDGCAVIIGGAAYYDVGGVSTLTGKSSDIEMYDVQMVDCGRDAEGTPGDNLGFSSISGVRILNADDVRIHGCTISGSKGAAVWISNSPEYEMTAIDVRSNNQYRNNGTQLLAGYGPVWFGGTPAAEWDATTLTAGSGTSGIEFTGVIHGKASPNGAAGIAISETRAEILAHHRICEPHEDLQAVMDEVQAIGGRGSIWLAGDATTGEHLIREPLLFRQGISLESRGPTRASIKVADDAGAETQYFRFASAGNEPSIVKGLTLDGNALSSSRMMDKSAGSGPSELIDVRFRNAALIGGGCSAIWCHDGGAGLRMKRVSIDNCDVWLSVTAGFEGLDIDEFVIPAGSWVSRVFWLRGDAGSFCNGAKIRSGYIYAPAVGPSNQPRQAFAIQCVTGGDFTTGKHENGLIEDVHMVGPGIPWRTGINDGATADQFSLHHCKGWNLHGCTSKGSGDVGFTVTQFCSDTTLDQCEGTECDTVGAAIGVLGGGTRRTTVIGGQYSGNALDAEGVHPSAMQGIGAKDSDDLRIVGGTRFRDDKVVATQVRGLFMENCKRYHVSADVEFGDGIVTPIDADADCTRAISSFIPFTSPGDRYSVSLDGSTDSRIQASSGEFMDVQVGVNDKVFRITAFLKVPSARPAVAQTLIGAASSRIKVELDTDGTFNLSLRSDVGTTESFSTTDPIPLIGSTGVWTRITFNYDTAVNSVEIGRGDASQLPTVWDVLHSEASTAAQSLSTTLNSSVICIGARHTSGGFEYPVECGYLHVEYGLTRASLATQWFLNTPLAHEKNGGDWSGWSSVSGHVVSRYELTQTLGSKVLALNAIELRYLSPEHQGQILRLSGVQYAWSPIDLSTEVTADPTMINYVAPISDTTGASGAWIATQSASASTKFIESSGTEVVISNSAAEEVLMSSTIPADTIGYLLFELNGGVNNSSGASVVMTMRIKLGGVTVWEDDTGAITTGAQTSTVQLKGSIVGSAPGAQKVHGHLLISSRNYSATAATDEIVANGQPRESASADETAPLLLEVTMQMDTADALAGFTVDSFLIEQK